VTKGLLSFPEFRRLWLVGLLTFVVRWLEMLAMGLYAYEVTGSAFVVAMMTMLRLLPMAMFGAFMGAAADRFERRTVLIVTVAVSMMSTLALGFLAGFDALQVWHLALASFINGICWTTDNPVRRMMIGDVVGPERMGRAMSLDVGTNNASRIIGPVLSGILLANFGIAGVFWLGVALYAVCLATALRIRVRHLVPSKHAASLIASMREGLAWVRGDRRLQGVLTITVIFNIFGWPVTSMVPVIGTDYLGLGPEGVGLLASCEGAGGLIGSVLMGSFARPQWYGRIYVGAVIAYLVMVVAFASAPWVSIAATALLMVGINGVGFSIMQATLVYRDSPVEMRARLLGVLSVCIGTGPIGFAYVGVLADVFTPRSATVALALQGMLALVLTRRYWIEVIRR
jgi:predicted MFS family arabinose efflux permease